MIHHFLPFFVAKITVLSMFLSIIYLFTPFSRIGWAKINTVYIFNIEFHVKGFLSAAQCKKYVCMLLYFHPYLNVWNLI